MVKTNCTTFPKKSQIRRRPASSIDAYLEPAAEPNDWLQSPETPDLEYIAEVAELAAHAMAHLSEMARILAAQAHYRRNGRPLPDGVE